MKQVLASLRTGRAWYVAPLALFALSRVIYALIIAKTVHLQTVDPSSSYGPARNVIDYWTAIANWDSATYFRIAEFGYPTGLPYNPDGSLGFSDLAFYPLWPQLLSWVHNLTGLSYPVTATILSLTFGAAALLILYRMVQHVSPSLALLLAAWLCFYPTSVMLQTGYAESLALLLLAIILKLLTDKQYYWALVPITLMAFTRPIVLAVGLLMLAYLIYRVVQRRRGVELGWKELVAILTVGAYSGFSFAFWPAYVGYATGTPLGYLKIQEVWRIEGTLSFFDPLAGGAPGLLMLAGFVGLALIALVSVLPTGQRAWPIMLTLWAPLYLAYIYLTTAQAIPFEAGKVRTGAPLHIGNSTWRYLFLCCVPLLPLNWAMARTSSVWVRSALCALLIIAGLIGSYYYITYCLLDRSGFLGAP